MKYTAKTSFGEVETTAGQDAADFLAAKIEKIFGQGVTLCDFTFRSNQDFAMA